MLTIEQKIDCLSRIAHDRVQTLSAEVEQLEEVRAYRSMTPDQERHWIGETLDESIDRRLHRKASIAGIAATIARRHVGRPPA